MSFKCLLRAHYYGKKKNTENERSTINRIWEAQAKHEAKYMERPKDLYVSTGVMQEIETETERYRIVPPPKDTVAKLYGMTIHEICTDQRIAIIGGIMANI